jgi:hypothetical protein
MMEYNHAESPEIPVVFSEKCREFFSILGSSVWRKELSERVASENPAVFKLLDELFKSNGHLGASSYVQISSG